jgi:hypothetical protein
LLPSWQYATRQRTMRAGGISNCTTTDNWVYEGGKATNWQNGGVHGAPGPIAGAGLPILAVGYGVYWLIRRRRKSQ